MQASTIQRHFRTALLGTPLLSVALLAPCAVAVAQPKPMPVQTANIDLRIGDQDGEKYELDRITSGILPTATGGVLVPQEKEGAIREFDGRGKYVRTIGRRGGGPGEFQSIDGMGVFGDTIWVADNTQRRVTMFAPNAKPSSVAVETYPASTSLVGPMRGGALFFRSLVATRDFLKGVRIAPNVLVDRKTNTPLLTRALPHSTTSVMVVNQGGVLSSTGGKVVTRAFSQDGLIDISNDGQVLVVVDRQVLTTAPGILPVDVYDARGTKKRSFRVQRAPTNVNSAFFNSKLDKWAGTMARLRKDTFTKESAAREFIDKTLNLPATYPLAGGLVVENENAIWIAEPYGATELFNLSTMAKDPGIVWERYNMQGVLQQRVRIPTAVELKAVRDGAFWGIAMDADDVQAVVRLRVKQ